MNIFKNFLLLLSAVFLCFVTIRCSEIPSSSEENNEMIVNNVESDGHNGPFLPENFFGSYKLIRPLPKTYLKLYMNYEIMMIWGSLTYLFSIWSSHPRIFRSMAVGFVAYLAAFHLPSLFGLHWVSSIKRQGHVSPVSIFTAIEGIFILDVFLSFFKKNSNEFMILRCKAFVVSLYFYAYYIPSLLGINFVASRKHSEGQILPESESIDEIFLAEEIVPFDRKVFFPIFYNIHRSISENISTLSELSRISEIRSDSSSANEKDL